MKRPDQNNMCNNHRPSARRGLAPAVLWASLVLAMPVAAADKNTAPADPTPVVANGALADTGQSADLSTAQAASPALPGASSSAASPVITDGLDPDGRLLLSVNRSRVLVTSSRLRSSDRDGAALTEGSPDVATLLPLSPNSVLVTAKKPGSTNLIIEDELGRRQLTEVVVEADLGAVHQQLLDLNPQSNIQATDDNGTIVLRGHVPNLKVADQAGQIAAAYAGSAGKVANLLEVSGGQQVMLQVKFAEVSKNAMSQLGVNFGYTDGKTFFGNNVGQINPFGINGSDLFTNTLAAAAPGANIQAFGNIRFAKSAFDYFVNALRQNQLMRTLAEPDLTTMSGEQASFQVGGQIPIPVPQQNGSGGAGGSVITIQYVNYGVILHFTPVVLGDGRVRLKIDPEVSDLDYAHGVSIGGFVVPGFTTRTVDTTVELADGQTFAIAGLLNNQVTATTNSMPGVGDIPIIGALFRSVQYQRNQTELVVMVTPRIVEAVNPDDVKTLPGEHWRYPSEADLFMFGDLGGEMAAKTGTPAAAAPATKTVGPPPLFQGRYGFSPSADTIVVEP